MLHRRSLLKGAALWPLATALAGCGSSPRGIQVALLNQSVPVQVVSAFRRSLDPSFPVDFRAEAQPQQLFQNLQTWNSANPPKNYLGRTQPIPDLSSLGDAWLGDAIRQQLIQPWDVAPLEGWERLEPRFKQVVRRNDQGVFDAQGAVWGLPYRWGTTAIAYRRSAFKRWDWEPQDWSDLWRPELKGRIGLPDQPREVIGLTLKSLGYSYNSSRLSAIDKLRKRLGQLQQQVKFYSSSHYAQPLLLKDVDVVVGWSTDLLPLSVLDRQIQVIVPQSGTALWVDMWVRPAKAVERSLEPVQSWVKFCWQSEIATFFSRFGDGTSPMSALRKDYIKDPKRSQVIYPKPEISDRSELLLPLPPETRAQYRKLWQEMREGLL